jgi:UDP-N-acetylglucosamine--N-acetylmuramyl-(pentapeptide) pyrophosphoryl-undecaprenol N-acetylglucosamine transferase
MASAKTIILCGGGSGGHITPLIAVAGELKKQSPKYKTVYIGERGGKFRSLAEDSKIFDEHYYVTAGKLRRYHGESLLRRVIDIKTVALNTRDLYRLFRGVLESIKLLGRIKPDVILLKGGFVCVPVALAARFRSIPLVTHDSDSVPGLSNRIAARFARYHATALPSRYYNYPKSSIREVGVPVSENFREYSYNEQAILREKFGIPINSDVLLITGGSNGARRLNAWMVEVLPELLDNNPQLYVVHHIGIGNEDQYNSMHETYKKRISTFGLTSELFHYSAIAKVIITRAGATTLSEFAMQKKACIIVPNPDLTGGHQLKNAQVYHDLDAALIIQERALKQSTAHLRDMVQLLMKDEPLRNKLGEHLHETLPKIPAAKALAQLLLEVVS